MVNDNVSITISLEELALLIQSKGLIKQIYEKFSSLPEFAGLNEAIRNLCLVDQEGLWEIKPLLDANHNIQITQNDFCLMKKNSPMGRLNSPV